MQMWAGSYQWCNALVPHLHKQDNLGEFVEISTMHVLCQLALACMWTIRNVRRKARCYQNYGKEILVRMRNIPMNVL